MIVFAPDTLALVPDPAPRPNADDDAASRWYDRYDAATVDVEILAALAYRQQGEIDQLISYLGHAYAQGDRAAFRGACAVIAALVLAAILVARFLGGM